MKESCVEAARKIRRTLDLLVSVCQKQHLAINPQADVGKDHTDVIEKIKKDILESVDNEELTKQGALENVSF